jgi:hypothetical protein
VKAKRVLNVRKVVQEFQKAEESTAHRNGTFKIDAPFEQALKTILKTKQKKIQGVKLVRAIV